MSVPATRFRSGRRLDHPDQVQQRLPRPPRTPTNSPNSTSRFTFRTACTADGSAPYSFTTSILLTAVAVATAGLAIGDRSPSHRPPRAIGRVEHNGPPNADRTTPPGTRVCPSLHPARLQVGGKASPSLSCAKAAPPTNPRPVRRARPHRRDHLLTHGTSRSRCRRRNLTWSLTICSNTSPT
jgi:hypothetical protein